MAFPGSTSASNMLTNPTTKPPQNAAPNPVTVKPSFQLSESQPVTRSMSAFITSVKSPKVRTISGQVRIVRRGLSVLLTIPKTAATINNRPIPPVNCKPGTMEEAAQSAAAFRIQCRRSDCTGSADNSATKHAIASPV